MAPTDRTWRDGKVTGGDYCGGATAAGAEGLRDPAGECGHDGAGEGHSLSHRRAAVSESAMCAGAGSQARKHRVAAGVPARGQAPAAKARTVPQRPATEQSAERNAGVANLP